jgi:hypothetical protein
MLEATRSMVEDAPGHKELASVFIIPGLAFPAAFNLPTRPRVRNGLIISHLNFLTISISTQQGTTIKGALLKLLIRVGTLFTYLDIRRAGPFAASTNHRLD